MRNVQKGREIGFRILDYSENHHGAMPPTLYELNLNPPHPMIFFAAITAISSLVGFAVSYQILAQKSQKSRIIGCVVLGIPAIPSILFSVYYLHILPEIANFYILRSWTGSECFAVFLGAAGGALSTLLPRFLLVIPLGLTLVTASVPYLKFVIYPLGINALKEQWKGDACLQSTESACGPASSASILRFLGYPSSEREIALAAHSTSNGTEAWYLARYFRSRGLKTQFEFHPTFDPSVSFPAVVGVKIGGFGHFIAVLKIQDGIVTFVDPLNGKRELSLKEFKQTYYFSGFHLSVMKTNTSH